MKSFLLFSIFLAGNISLQAQKTEAPDSLKEINAVIKSIQQHPSLAALRDTLAKRISKRNVPYQAVCTDALQTRGRKTEINSYQVCFEFFVRLSDKYASSIYELNTHSFDDTIYYVSLKYQRNDSKPVYLDSVLFEQAI